MADKRPMRDSVRWILWTMLYMAAGATLMALLYPLTARTECSNSACRQAVALSAVIMLAVGAFLSIGLFKLLAATLRRYPPPPGRPAYMTRVHIWLPLVLMLIYIGGAVLCFWMPSWGWL